MSDADDRLRRLERRIHVRLDARRALGRVVDSIPAILQITLGAVVAYAIAHWVLGHAAPILAIAVTISSLGLARDARPRRVAESVLGILLGVSVSAALTALVGSGVWQLAVVLLVVLVVGRLVSANPSFAVSAAIPSSLAVLLPPTTGGPFAPTLDALVAGVVALLVTALVPRDPGRAAARDRRVVFSVLRESMDGIVDALEHGDPPAAELALARLRRSEPLLADWRESLETAISVARISPFLRGRLPELARSSRALECADLAIRHLRPLARRIEHLVRDHEPRPALAGVAGEVRRGLVLLGDELDDPLVAGSARSVLSDLTRRLDPALVVPGAAVTEAAIVLVLRPLAIDLLAGTGMDLDEARKLLPDV